MQNNTYKALVVKKRGKNFNVQIEQQSFTALAADELLIKVNYSSLNYKDCLSLTGHHGITRKYPHIPGIDVAGYVAEANSAKFKQGEEVIVTGYDLGMNISGGFAEYVKVPAVWVVKKPDNLTLRQAMLFGTAGFTAMSSYLFLQDHFKNLANRDILITGVSGGVGLISSFLLSKEKAKLTLASRNIANHPLAYLAANMLDSQTLLSEVSKPLLTRNYAAAIDNLGGLALTNIIKQLDYAGMVCACGNVAGHLLESSIYPFILRGVTLRGISSANCVYALRVRIWLEIAKFNLWAELENFITEISLAEISNKANLMLGGKHFGRFLVKL